MRLTDCLTNLAMSVCRARAIEKMDAQSPEPFQGSRPPPILRTTSSGSHSSTVPLVSIDRPLFRMSDTGSYSSEDEEYESEYLQNTPATSPPPLIEDDLLKRIDGHEEPNQTIEEPEKIPEKHDGAPDEGYEEVDQTMARGDQDGQGECRQLQTPDRAPLSVWDNGEEITAEERMFLLAMESDLERARAMTIRRRDREAVEQGLIDKVPSLMTGTKPITKSAPKKPRVPKAKKPPIKKPPAKAPPAATTHAKDTDQAASEGGGQRRKSARHLKDRNLADHSSSTVANDHNSRTTPLLSANLIEPDNSLANPTLDEDAPPLWIEEAMPYLLAMCDDVHWTSLLLKWVELERQLGFITGRVSTNLFSFLFHKLINSVVKDQPALNDQPACANRNLAT